MRHGGYMQLEWMRYRLECGHTAYVVGLVGNHKHYSIAIMPAHMLEWVKVAWGSSITDPTGAVHKHEDGTWWYTDEADLDVGPFPTEGDANKAFGQYIMGSGIAW